LLIPIPQLIDLALEPLHILQDIIRVLALFTTTFRHFIRLFTGRIQRVLASPFLIRRRILVAKGVLAGTAGAPVMVETRAPQVGAGAAAGGGRRGRKGGEGGARLVEARAVGARAAAGWGRGRWHARVRDLVGDDAAVSFGGGAGGG